MSASAMYASQAAQAAIEQGGLTPDALVPERTAVIVGSEMGGVNDLEVMQRLLHAGKKSRAGATGVTKAMDSTASGNIAALFGLRGRSYTVAAGSASGLAAIRHGYQLLACGMADIALCGATEEDCWRQLAPALGRCGQLASGYDDQPQRACRPFDAARTGTVLSAGSGILLLESAEHAQQRGARVQATIVGCGSAGGDGPTLRATGRGLRRAIDAALLQAGGHNIQRIDFVHAGAKGTRVGDAAEAGALRDSLADGPWVVATAGLTGFALGASDAIRVVLSLLMLRDQFVAPTTNLETVSPECEGLRHVDRGVRGDFRVAMCTAISYGSCNECLILRLGER